MFNSDKKIYKPLNWLVNDVIVLNYNYNSPSNIAFIPRLDCSIICHFKELPQILFNNQFISVDNISLVPVIDHVRYIKLFQNHEAVIINCKPTVLSRIFKIDLTPSFNAFYHLPNDIISKLESCISINKTLDENMQAFENIINLYHNKPYVPDAIDIIYNKIINNSNNIHLKELTQLSDKSTRTLQRVFLKRTGVTMKLLNRLTRFNYIIDNLYSNNNSHYIDFIYDQNFFDQSHFIKDFKKIIGDTPSHFKHNDQTLLKIMSGRI